MAAPRARRRLRASADARRPVSLELVAGSQGYPNGYPRVAVVSTDHSTRGEREDPAHGDSTEPQKFWERLGFESFRAYMDYLEDQQSRRTLFGGGGPRIDLPSADTQVPSEAESPRPRSDSRPDVRQVGLKLAREDYDQLAEAADAYGVRPTTLARMLIRRGVRAMLKADRAERSGS
jgi:hypothetical protein